MSGSWHFCMDHLVDSLCYDKESRDVLLHTGSCGGISWEVKMQKVKSNDEYIDI